MCMRQALEITRFDFRRRQADGGDENHFSCDGQVSKVDVANSGMDAVQRAAAVLDSFAIPT